MYFQNLLLFLIISIININYSTAQTNFNENEVSMIEIDRNPILKDFSPSFTDIELHNIIRIDSKHSKIYYTKRNTNFEAVINSNEKTPLLIASFKEINIESLPIAIKNIFDSSRYGITEILKVFITSSLNEIDYFRIDIFYKNKSKSLYYNKLGRYHKPPY